MAGRRGMPFTSEQMQQVFNTNMIDFVVGKGYEIEKGSRHSVHVKHSGGLYLFNNGRGYYCFSTQSKGNIIDFTKEYFGVDFIGAVEMILGTRAYEVTEHVIPPKEVEPRKPCRILLFWQSFLFYMFVIVVRSFYSMTKFEKSMQRN